MCILLYIFYFYLFSFILFLLSIKQFFSHQNKRFSHQNSFFHIKTVMTASQCFKFRGSIFRGKEHPRKIELRENNHSYGKTKTFSSQPESSPHQHTTVYHCKLAHFAVIHLADYTFSKSRKVK